MALLGAACTVHDLDVPPLTGPSELSLRLNMQAVPDTILQDGISQTVVNIEATGSDGRPVRGLSLRVETTFNGIIQDFGFLSSKNVVTGDDGRTRVTYTAPPRPTSPIDPVTVVQIQATPIGTDFGSQVPRFVDVRLITPGVILPPNDAPVAKFTFTPGNPAALTTVTFDASTSTDEGAPCGANCAYTWDFGDGERGSGIFATHQYRSAGTFQVRLTVSDARGAAGVTASSITVGAGTPPTAAFSFSPTSPAINQAIFFTAEASRPATGRRLVSYDWSFGNGRTGSGVTASQAYSAAGTYTVTLTVTDDGGQQGTATQTISAGTAGTGPTANLVVSPTQGTTATNFFFDASASRPGPSPIVGYQFSFGDGEITPEGGNPTALHKYTLAGTYVARVVVRDSQNRTATVTITVTVQ